MQFATVAPVLFALAVLFFLFIRRQVIATLQKENAELRKEKDKLSWVAQRQHDEITNLIKTAEQERRARQMATLSAIGAQSMSKTPAVPPLAKKQHSTARTPAKVEDIPANRWNDPGSAFVPVPVPSNAPSTEAMAALSSVYHGGGGSFDGGGASGNYGSSSGSSDSSSSSSCSSSSSDSGSSSSSDSGSSCSSD